MPQQLDLMEWIERFPDFGTPPHKLVRRDAPKTSVDAACRVKTTKGEQRVYEAIKSFGALGCIADDIRDKYPHLPYSTITARPASLLEKGYIEVIGEREGHSGSMQRVLRAV